MKDSSKHPNASFYKRRLMPRLGLALAAGLVLTVIAGLPGDAQSKASSDVKIIVYDGKLQGADSKAISGIYPLQFELHRRAKGGRAMWKETHFVAVDSGSYTVELGRKTAIAGSIKLDKAYLGVALGGGNELFRERLDINAVRNATSPRGKAPATAPRASAGIPAKVTMKGGKSVVDYAEEAGEAYVAGQAKVAERIGSLTAKDIEAAVEKLKKFKGGGGTLGRTKKMTNLVGGPKGVPYTLACPKGHVVTGITGGAGLFIDSLKLICQPLE